MSKTDSEFLAWVRDRYGSLTGPERDRLFALATRAGFALEAENERLRALLKRHLARRPEPECEIADDKKCDACVCGWEQWKTDEMVLEDETRAALQDKSYESAVTQWISIETAPKDGRSILVWAPGQEPEKAIWDSQPDCNCWCIDVVGPWECNPLYFVPTHWMPLPLPPEDKSDESGEGKADE
jgi:hypothetical protein